MADLDDVCGERRPGIRPRVSNAEFPIEGRNEGSPYFVLPFPFYSHEL